jgi:hypothetical protein
MTCSRSWREAIYADPELLDLINRADRSHSEEHDHSSMTDQEFALFQHIDGEHRRLSAKARQFILVP